MTMTCDNRCTVTLKFVGSQWRWSGVKRVTFTDLHVALIAVCVTTVLRWVWVHNIIPPRTTTRINQKFRFRNIGNMKKKDTSSPQIALLPCTSDSDFLQLWCECGCVILWMRGVFCILKKALCEFVKMKIKVHEMIKSAWMLESLICVHLREIPYFPLSAWMNAW